MQCPDQRTFSAAWRQAVVGWLRRQSLISITTNDIPIPINNYCYLFFQQMVSLTENAHRIKFLCIYDMNEKYETCDLKSPSNSIDIHKGALAILKKKAPLIYYLPVYLCIFGGAFGFIFGGTLGNHVFKESASGPDYAILCQVGGAVGGSIFGYIGFYIKKRKSKYYIKQFDNIR